MLTAFSKAVKSLYSYNLAESHNKVHWNVWIRCTQSSLQIQSYYLKEGKIENIASSVSATPFYQQSHWYNKGLLTSEVYNRVTNYSSVVHKANDIHVVNNAFHST